jgi:hypothetical protein
MMGELQGVKTDVSRAVHDTNQRQRDLFFKKILGHFGGEQGLPARPSPSGASPSSPAPTTSAKPRPHDRPQGPRLRRACRGFDPVAMENVKKEAPTIDLFEDMYECRQGRRRPRDLDRLGRVQEPRLRQAREAMKGKAIFDGRNLYRRQHLGRDGWHYYSRSDPHRRLESLQAAPPHLEDTAQVQLERVVLSPLYYIIASLGTELAQQAGLRPYWAVGIGYPLALVVTRSLHTWWGLRSGTFHDHHIREKRARIEARRARRLIRSEGRGPSPDL